MMRRDKLEAVKVLQINVNGIKEEEDQKRK